MLDSLAGDVEQMVGEMGVSAKKLHIELTERMDIRSWGAVQKTMGELSELGCSLSLDDFGAGYASLQWLEALPFDTLKVDKSLVARLPARRSREMVRAIVSMAVFVNVGLFLGSLIFMASGQSFEQFRGIQ